MLQVLEQLPFIDHWAGPRWFRHFIANPVPSHIFNIRGRYKGSLLKGFILITFDFEPPFERLEILKSWERSETNLEFMNTCLNLLLKRQIVFDWQWFKPEKSAWGSSTFLFIDESQNVGVLYEAAYFPMHKPKF